jgi:hypothetical protein
MEERINRASVLSTTAKFELQYLEYESLSMNQHTTFEYQRERMQCREATAMQISPPFKSYGVGARIAWPSCLDTAYSVSYYKTIHMHRAHTQGILKGIHTQADLSFENWRSSAGIGLLVRHYSAIIRQSTIRVFNPCFT